MELLVAHGAPATRPAALVAQGTAPEQRVRLTTLEALAASGPDPEFGSPVLLIVGDVVALQPVLAWFETAAGEELTQRA